MNWWHYLLLVNIYLVLFYGFYTLLLRKETFFQLNRLYLVSASLLSFIIPLIQSESVKHMAITEKVHYSIYGGDISIAAYKPLQSSPVTIGEVFTWLYLAGIAFLTLRFIIQLIKVNKLINTPAPTSAAYSFFKKISLGENMVKQDVVMAHEQVHAQQWHSVDVLLIEAVMIVNWFNPIVYLYRFAIKHIHEFIADQQAIKVGVDKAEYALLLLSQTFSAPSHQLVNPFFTHSLLKKRIMMIQKNKSHRIVLFKYILSAPLFGLMLILSSATINNSKAVAAIHAGANDVFSEPAAATINGIVQHGEIPDLNDGTVTADADYQQVPDQQNKIYDKVDKVPVFPGGIKGFSLFLSKNVKYPADAHNAGIQGKVIVQFVVEKDGSITDVRALRGPSESLKKEAVRAIKRSPKWKPGSEKGKNVRVSYTVPVNFTLERERPNQEKPTTVDEPIGEPPVGYNPANDINKVYDSADKEPAFPGGPSAFNTFLSHTVKYPAKDRENNVQGKVIIQFIVEKDGSLTNIKAVRGPSVTTKEAAEKALALSPKWAPGVLGGHIVRVSYTIPVNFTLSNDERPQEGKPIRINEPVDGGADVQQVLKDPNRVYDAVEKEPTFPGGPEAYAKFLSQAVKYPAIDRQNNITGKVIVQFTVEKDGALSDIKAIRGPSATTMEAAAKGLSLSPKWNPGIQNGRAVRVSYTVPVNFTLSGDSKPPKTDNKPPKEDAPPVGALNKNPNPVYDAVEKEPSFPGGIDAFNKFLSNTVKYPSVDRQNNVTGKVIIQFIVEKDGSLSNIKAVRGPSATTKEAAETAMAFSPKWIPGIQNGRSVRVSYTIPVTFVLSSDQ